VVRMKRHPTDDRYVAEIDGLDDLATHALDASVFDGDRIRGHFVAVPGVTVGQQLGTINWCRDADFLETVVSRALERAQRRPARPVLGSSARARTRKTPSGVASAPSRIRSEISLTDAAPPTGTSSSVVRKVMSSSRSVALSSSSTSLAASAPRRARSHCPPSSATSAVSRARASVRDVSCCLRSALTCFVSSALSSASMSARLTASSFSSWTDAASASGMTTSDPARTATSASVNP
jgi:hypothetical protein